MSWGASRWTGKNIARGIAAFIFGAFVAYYVLLIGLYAKKPKVIAEGALYAIVFSVMIALPVGFLGALPAFLGVGAMIASGVRSYQLRDLWLPLPGRSQQPGWMTRPGWAAQPPPHSQVHPAAGFTAQPTFTMPATNTAQPTGRPSAPPEPATPGGGAPSATPRGASSAPGSARPANSGLPDDLSVSVEWVSSTAKRNKHRLPAEAYIAILETSQELAALISAEQTSPSNDAAFEYELEAMVTQYLPSVLKGYLAIPPSMIEQVQPNGKTPNAELVEQLDLLAGQTGALYSSRYSHTTAGLTTTGNFLRERFGHQRSEAFDFGVE